MPEDKLHDCYIWHIITLAKLKCKLKELKDEKNRTITTDQSNK